jgi:hypothetical protein
MRNLYANDGGREWQAPAYHYGQCTWLSMLGAERRASRVHCTSRWGVTQYLDLGQGMFLYLERCLPSVPKADRLPPLAYAFAQLDDWPEAPNSAGSRRLPASENLERRYPFNRSYSLK